MGANIAMNNNTEQLQNRLHQRRTWYKCILNDLNTKRLDIFDVDPMLDLLNIVKMDINNLEAQGAYAVHDERNYMTVRYNVQYC
jgi:hypothetical protein